MLEFYKYHGAGNDFILIDNRDRVFDKNDTENIKLLCHRHFGIGADGIILLENHPDYNFEMIFINNDGSIGSMCGNGGRCIVHFADRILGIVGDPNNIEFKAVDGEHKAIIGGNEVKLKMQDITDISTRNDLPFLSSGTTPHNIVFVEDIENYPVLEEGRKIRYSDPEGMNTNFVEEKDGIFYVRTYERGVEYETMACGTGATCVAIFAHHKGMLKENVCHIKMPGGDLKIEFIVNEETGNYENIWLSGPAVCVFKGKMK
ncbi:MAG: Diaminopimelate epimerase [Patescibacteria group bacterium]|nr:Diaminopimelate epimerase [Patescibacteria group bacterium]